eukprot:1137229-Pleurochrysis_carterae.AAC.1
MDAVIRALQRGREDVVAKACRGCMLKRVLLTIVGRDLGQSRHFTAAYRHPAFVSTGCKGFSGPLNNPRPLLAHFLQHS